MATLERVASVEWPLREGLLYKKPSEYPRNHRYDKLALAVEAAGLGWLAGLAELAAAGGALAAGVAPEVLGFPSFPISSALSHFSLI